MKRNDDLEKRLDTINKALEDSLSRACKNEVSACTPKELAKFGLTIDEAKAWLEKEPSFPSDASYHEPRNRRKVNRTDSFYI
jgi:hypothetical protein